MKLIILLFFIFMVTSAVLLGLSTLSVKTWLDFQKSSPFECGYSPKSFPSAPFSLQFFLITLIFLIFDVELIILFPYLTVSMNSFSFMGVFVSIVSVLTFGFLWEWKQGMLEWALY